MQRTPSLLVLALSLLPFAPLGAQGSGDRVQGCDDLRRSGTTTRISSNSEDEDPEGRKFEILVSKPGHCIEARLEGEVKFSDDETTVASLGRGALAMFRERTRDSDRAVRFVPAPGGGVRARLFEDGREGELDAEGRAWLAGLLPKLLRETGVGAEERVERLRAQHGIDGALREIATIESGSGRRAHFVALLRSPGVSGDEAAAIVRQASAANRSSSGDLREILEGVPVRLRRSPPLRAAVMSAVGSMKSDGDKRSILLEYAATADRDLLLAVLRETPSIDSDGDKRAILIENAEVALGDADADLQRAWFDAYSAIDSDGDKRGVLMSALPSARTRPALTAEIIRAVGQIDSDGDASGVLVRIAGRGLLTTPELRAAYLAAARAIDSDSDRRRVIEAADRAG